MINVFVNCDAIACQSGSGCGNVSTPAECPPSTFPQLDNILLHDDLATPDRPMVKLADWGFSKNEVLSSCNTALGTPEYIAPEVRCRRNNATSFPAQPLSGRFDSIRLRSPARSQL